MVTAYCVSCGRVTGFKRHTTILTLVMVACTFLCWLVIIPFYPKRCKVCGSRKQSGQRSRW